MSARTCVIVSYWVERSLARLHRLLRQMTRVNGGADFDLVVVCNGGDRKPLTLSDRFDGLKPRVLNRENVGYNLGAWNAGWKSASSDESYLFLQDDCFLKRAGWISHFEFRMAHDLGVGLLGESIMWDRASWPYIRAATDRDFEEDHLQVEGTHPIELYKAAVIERGIPLGNVGSHLQSLILFTTKEILEEIGGFPSPPANATKDQAIGCEVALSRLVESKGYRISKVKDDPFYFIGHPQWTRFGLAKMRAGRRLLSFLPKSRPSPAPPPPSREDPAQDSVRQQM